MFRLYKSIVRRSPIPDKENFNKRKISIYLKNDQYHMLDMDFQFESYQWVLEMRGDRFIRQARQSTERIGPAETAERIINDNMPKARVSWHLQAMVNSGLWGFGWKLPKWEMYSYRRIIRLYKDLRSLSRLV